MNTLCVILKRTDILNMDISLTELLQEIGKRRENEARYTREGFYEIIDEVMEEYRKHGLITDDDDTEVVRSQLRSYWPLKNN